MSGFDPRTPFLRRTAIAAGVTAKELRGPRYRSVLPGAYVAAATVVHPGQRALAALLPYGTVAWAIHASAARVYDLPLPVIALEHVSVPRAGQRRRHQGTKVHVGGADRASRIVRGIRVSEPRMLCVEMAGLIGLVDLVDLGDAIDDDGWRLLPVISSGIFAKPEETLRRVHRVLLARGPPGVPLRLSDAWRAHFPGHADAA